MSTESIVAKADGYLTGGHVTVIALAGDTVSATVKGSDPKPYAVERIAGVWRCSCPAMVSHCAHIHAVSKIVPDAQDTNPELFSDSGNDLSALFDSLAADHEHDTQEMA